MFNNSSKSKLMLSMRSSFEQRINTHLSRIFTSTTNQMWSLCFEKSRLRDRFRFYSSAIKNARDRESFFETFKIAIAFECFARRFSHLKKRSRNNWNAFFIESSSRFCCSNDCHRNRCRCCCFWFVCFFSRFSLSSSIFFFFAVFVLSVFVSIVLSEQQFLESHKAN